MKKLPPSFVTTRDGVNAARALFEHAGWIVQPVDQQNDFGKDAYVDITKSGLVTPICIAVQIKSGLSYRMSSGGFVSYDALSITSCFGSLWRSGMSSSRLFQTYRSSPVKTWWCRAGEVLSRNDARPLLAAVGSDELLGRRRR